MWPEPFPRSRSRPAALAKAVGAWLVAAVVIAVGGCDRGRVSEDAVLVRVAEFSASTNDFFQALELAKVTYERDRLDDPEVYRRLCDLTLAQLIEELVLEKAAADMGLGVSSAELEGAVDQIRRDYPEQALERMMLEKAVAAQAWKKRLRARILMDKVIARLPEATAPADPQALAEAARHMGRSVDRQADARALLSLVRRQKAEAAYERWLQRMHQQVTVTIATEVWERVAGGSSTAAPPRPAAPGQQ